MPVRGAGRRRAFRPHVAADCAHTRATAACAGARCVWLPVSAHCRAASGLARRADGLLARNRAYLRGVAEAQRLTQAQYQQVAEQKAPSGSSWRQVQGAPIGAVRRTCLTALCASCFVLFQPQYRYYRWASVAARPCILTRPRSTTGRWRRRMTAPLRGDT